MEFSRTGLLIGKEGINRIKNSKIIIFGIGGVGGYVVEALARSGAENLTLVDNDTVSISNINRQIIALHSTVGMAKVDVMKNRILDINPNVKVNAINCFYNAEASAQFDFSKYDYVIDAIDTVSAKIDIIEKCYSLNVPVISSMGAGNKLNPTEFEVADIYKTSVCPLARVMRYELKKRGIKKLKVVYSKEKPIETDSPIEEESKKKVPGSISFVPSVVGLIIASEVIKDIIGE